MTGTDGNTVGCSHEGQHSSIHFEQMLNFLMNECKTKNQSCILLDCTLYTVISKIACLIAPPGQSQHTDVPVLKSHLETPLNGLALGTLAPSREKRPAFLWWHYWLLETKTRGWKKKEGDCVGNVEPEKLRRWRQRQQNVADFSHFHRIYLCETTCKSWQKSSKNGILKKCISQ